MRTATRFLCDFIDITPLTPHVNCEQLGWNEFLSAADIPFIVTLSPLSAINNTTQLPTHVTVTT